MSDLVLRQVTDTIAMSEEYDVMVQKIMDVLPTAMVQSENFYKSSSQFKIATLDITNLTPLNSLKHTLAVVVRTRDALQEANTNLKKQQLELKRKEHALQTATGFDAEELQIEIESIKEQMTNSEGYVRAAIRKLAFLMEQHEALLDKLGVDYITEEMYEQDETEYHIKTAFMQALTAARARQGIIDEGNHIYMFQLGINGAVAQQEVTALLMKEQELLQRGETPTHQLVVDWLQACADKYAPNPTAFAVKRGMVPFDPDSVLTSAIPANLKELASHADLTTQD